MHHHQDITPHIHSSLAEQLVAQLRFLIGNDGYLYYCHLLTYSMIFRGRKGCECLSWTA